MTEENALKLHALLDSYLALKDIKECLDSYLAKKDIPEIYDKSKDIRHISIGVETLIGINDEFVERFHDFIKKETHRVLVELDSY